MVALLLGTATLPSLARKKKQVKAVAAEQDTIPANDKKRFDYPMRLRCIISSRCITHK